MTPGRHRWEDVHRFDERVNEIDNRQAQRRDELVERQQALALAPAQDADALGRWKVDGEKGPRPEPTAPALEARIRELELEVASDDVARNHVLEEKADYVAKHRTRLVKDADRDVEAHKARMTPFGKSSMQRTNRRRWLSRVPKAGTT